MHRQLYSPAALPSTLYCWQNKEVQPMKAGI